MITTEENARYIACPFAASFNAGHGRQYFHGGESKRQTDHAMCIGSACMAWDWIDPEWISPNAYIEKPDGNWGAAGETVRQEYATEHGTGVPAETKEDFIERLTKVRLAEGFKRQEKFAVDSISGWRKPHPARRGQCGRTHILEISQG